MKLQTVITATAIAVAVGLSLAMTANAFDGQQYLKVAKVSLQQARKIALRVSPGGRIVHQELETEKGGSGLRYSFDVATAKGAREVGVDAKSGAVLENSKEGSKGD